MTVLNEVVEKVEGPTGRIYIGLAKMGLWTCSLSLSAVISQSITQLVHGDKSAVSNLTQACSVLSMICVTVLGYHGYKGTRIFHALRHWDDET
jgi:hypothetical protein